MDKMPELWDVDNLSKDGSSRAFNNVISDSFQRYAIKHGIPIYRSFGYGQFDPGYKEDYVIEALGRLGFRPFILDSKILNYQKTSYSHGLTYFKHDMGACCIGYVGNRCANIDLYVFDPELEKATKEVFNSFFHKEDYRGVAYVLTSSSGGLRLSPLSDIGTEFIPENYTPDVVEGYDYICKEFSKDTPRGRIAILNGEPGTGKTHLIQSMIKSLKSTTFIMIPSNVIQQVTNPDFLTLLLGYSGKKVLILEDSDSALVKRDGYNDNLISGLLNLADGIFGKGLNLRIVATTNAEDINLDPAILRPGRLCRRVHVGSLPPDQARMILKRLAPSREVNITKHHTLAEVYGLANEINTGHVESKKRAMGF